MKRKISKIILLFIMVSFLFVTEAKADGASIKCPKTATVGTPFTCEVTTDQTIYISTDLRIYKGSTTMQENGKIEFKANEAKDYDISIVSYNDDGASNTFDTATVTVKEAVTTTKTTTTTTKAKSDNNYLSSISVNDEEISDFSKTTTKYYVEVDNDVTKISIDATAEDELASVDIDGPKSLAVGDNEYTISVTSESNTTKIYKVIVTRAEEEKSSSTDIKNIKIKGYNLNFDKNSKTFHLNIDKEDTELDIAVTLKDKNADYEIEGNEDLQDGSEIKIKVTAEDGTTDTYRIIIEKKETNIMPVIIGLVALLIIIIVIVIIVINKKKKNGDSKNNKIEEEKTKKVIKDNDVDEKTKEMPTINSEEEKSDNYDDEYEQIPIDNDEEEKTRMLSFAEEEKLEKTKVINSDLDNDIDEEFEKTMLFNSDDFDDE